MENVDLKDHRLKCQSDVCQVGFVWEYIDVNMKKCDSFHFFFMFLAQLGFITPSILKIQFKNDFSLEE